MQLLEKSRSIFHRWFRPRRSTLVLSAGMPRSGSTWLYNAARLLLLQRHGADEVGGGWIGDWATLAKKKIMLLKIHDYEARMARWSSLILYSYRDVRDALASSKRKFGGEPGIEQARHWLDADRRWRAQARFQLRYETMIADPRAAVRDLAGVLGVDGVDAESTVRQLARLDCRREGDAYDRQTLLHPHHITDGRHGSWTQWLSPELVTRIEEEFAGWLRDNDYLNKKAEPTPPSRR